MNLNQRVIAEAKKFLQHCVQKIPASSSAVEQQRYISEQIVEKVSEAQRLLIKKLFRLFLDTMRQKEASDMDFGGMGACENLWLRIHGNKFPLPELGSYSPDVADILIQILLSDKERTILLKKRSYDFSYVVSDANNQMMRYRASVYFELDHISISLRAINMTIRPYPSYKFHPLVTKIFSLAYTKEGLILITGITGSGKSTTLDAIVDLNNQTVNAHIVIIASPVEYVHTSQKCIIKHREVGSDTQSFELGAQEALRQDPDIIIIGEMRDPETIMTALEVADSGHKVFSTLHTSSAVESIDRIVGEMSAIEQERVRHRLADVLRCVVSQKLVPSTSGRRILAKEIMVMTPSVRAAIKNGNVSEIYQMISEGSEYGMNTLEQDLLRLQKSRQISMQTALNFANNKRRMQQLLHDKLLLRTM